MALLQLADFSPSVSEEFSLDHPEGRRKLLLIEAKRLGGQQGAAKEGHPHDRPGGPFSLLFEGAADEAFEQGSFKMEREGLGVFDIFLVPIGRSEASVRYEAVFN